MAPDMKLGLTVGYSGATPEDHADIAMEAEKEAKHTGRNKVVTRTVAAPPVV